MHPLPRERSSSRLRRRHRRRRGPRRRRRRSRNDDANGAGATTSSPDGPNLGRTRVRVPMGERGPSAPRAASRTPSRDPCEMFRTRLPAHAPPTPRGGLWTFSRASPKKFPKVTCRRFGAREKFGSHFPRHAPAHPERGAERRSCRSRRHPRRRGRARHRTRAIDASNPRTSLAPKPLSTRNRRRRRAGRAGRMRHRRRARRP